MAEPLCIEITPEDLMVAAVRGTCRQTRAMMAGRVGHDHGMQSSRKRAYSQSWIDSIIGDIGEIELERATGVPTASRYEDMSASDLGNWEVRTTDNVNGNLLIHQTSPDDKAYVLVVIDFSQGSAVAKIYGWITAAEGRQVGSERDGDPPYYLVGRNDLHAIERLQS